MPKHVVGDDRVIWLNWQFTGILGAFYCFLIYDCLKARPQNCFTFYTPAKTYSYILTGK